MKSPRWRVFPWWREIIRRIMSIVDEAEDCFDKVGEDGKRGVTDCRGFSSNGRYEQALQSASGGAIVEGSNRVRIEESIRVLRKG